MNILLVYPEYPDTFWSFKHAVRFVAKKAALPPLGLLTVAALLPADWHLKLVDLNITSLRDKDILWADYVFISAMIVQRDSARKIVDRCHGLGTNVVAGGPLFTSNPDAIAGVDHVVIGEAETSIPHLIQDLVRGEPKKRYQGGDRPDITRTPPPRWDLLKQRHYVSMAVQYSRGCPYNCEFCDIIILNGRIPRTKTPSQLLTEFELLYLRGWRGPVFIVDDNFIGNRKKVKTVLREVRGWMEKRNYPFSLFTETSLNLAEDDVLLDLMAGAGFKKVFIGLETPEEESLAECSKLHNKSKDDVMLVRKIQNHGMEVLGGFILGFDHDSPSIFEKQIQYIQNLGVATAMVGLLNALPGTRLYQRLEREGRLLMDSAGNNVDTVLNFIPKMDAELLVEGYRKVLGSIYSVEAYYQRVNRFLDEYRPVRRGHLSFQDLLALPRSALWLGLMKRGRLQYWRLVLRCLFKRPRVLPEAVTLAIIGFHFREVLRRHSLKPA